MDPTVNFLGGLQAKGQEKTYLASNAVKWHHIPVAALLHELPEQCEESISCHQQKTVATRAGFASEASMMGSHSKSRNLNEATKKYKSLQQQLIYPKLSSHLI
jgi:hypothetical protein